MNLKQLEKALKVIEKNPKKYNQRTHFRCGTSMCLAGFVAEAAGWKWKEKRFDVLSEFAEVVVKNGRRLPGSLLHRSSTCTGGVPQGSGYRCARLETW